MMRARRPQTTAIIELALERVRPAVIARRLGLNVYQVYSAINYARKTGAKIAPFPTARDGDGVSTGTSRPVLIHGRTLAALAAHAERRGLTVNQLVRRIVGAVADDDMIDAVLDDGR